MKFILTDSEGKLLGCYSELESAEMDAKDLVSGKSEDFKVSVYELINAQKLGEPILQNTYELRKNFPEPDEEKVEEKEAGEDKEDKEDKKKESKSEDKSD